MRRTIPTILTAAALAFGAGPALAQDGDDGQRGQGQGMMGQQGQGMMGQGRMMRDCPGAGSGGQGMMRDCPKHRMRHGEGRMGHGKHHGTGMGRHHRGGMMAGAGGRGMTGMMSPQMMTMVFILADTNGNGTLSLEEVLAVEERFFHHIDRNGDGEMTRGELRRFMRSMTGGGMGMGRGPGRPMDDDDAEEDG